MTAFVIKVIVAYLVGSLSGSLVLGRFKGVDIRTAGSGNAGGTNALRTQGKAFGIAVLVFDMVKGVVAAGVLPCVPMGLTVTGALLPWLAVTCAVAAVAGHVWPVWFGFRGGKGAATLVGVLIAVAPWGLVPVLGVFALTLMLSGFVGLSTLLAALAFVVYALLAWAGFAAVSAPVVCLGVMMAAFVTYTHRGNIQRLRAGTENQFNKAMILRRRSR